MKWRMNMHAMEARFAKRKYKIGDAWLFCPSKMKIKM